ncbi:MAG: acyl-[ACP]--phospholipid O-acyltransferase, partial [Rhodospirillales bacterium]|nr:acyl-[ACP]--phospholipid O-acyltransferase [Rhodospirillales bacterium]
LGVQAAMFGPVKYGVLPELLRPEELVAGNGVIEAGTFLAIVGGTVVGGMLALLPAGPALVSALGLAVSVLGVVSARWIPAQQAADRRLRIRLNIVAETWHLVRQAFAHPTIRWSILGISWFWLVGATLMTEFPVLARDTIGADGSVLTLFLPVFAVGVGLGSIGAARVLHGRLSGRWVPVAGLVISGVLGDLLVLAAAGGLFSVPLYALMQDAADASRRSRTIAANNVINALFMVAGAGLTAALATAGLDAPAVLQAAAGANLCVAIGLARVWAPRPFGLGS